MHIELLLMRHGKSDWSRAVDDFRRPLKKRGRRGAQRIGAWLRQQGLLPDHVVSSPAERASATARLTCEAVGLPVERIVYDERIYEAGINALLQVLADTPAKTERVLLVGHNPGLENLLIYLADQPVVLPDDANLMPTATLARFRLAGDWQSLDAGAGRLLSITRGRNLPD